MIYSPDHSPLFTTISRVSGTLLSLVVLTTSPEVLAHVGHDRGFDNAVEATDNPASIQAVLLPEKALGEYKLVILSEVEGEKLNGRFSFNR